MADIVVGADGSDASIAAVQWAVDEAGFRGCAVRVIHVYDTSPLYFSEFTAFAEMGKLASQVREEAEAFLSDLVNAELDRHPDVSVSGLAVDASSPARVLTEQAADADLLVVGTRGHGGFAGLVLGSVSHQCVSHPPCPVTVVPPLE